MLYDDIMLAYKTYDKAGETLWKNFFILKLI